MKLNTKIKIKIKITKSVSIVKKKLICACDLLKSHKTNKHLRVLAILM